MMQKCGGVYVKYSDVLSTGFVFICQHLHTNFLLKIAKRPMNFLFLEMLLLAYVELHYVVDYVNYLELREDRPH